MEGEYYEVIAPEVWQKADPYLEYAYEETVKIVKGKGTCKSASTAGKLEKLGYKVIHHKPEVVVMAEEPDEKQGATDEPDEKQGATDESFIPVKTGSD